MKPNNHLRPIHLYLPILLALAIMAGVFLGTKVAPVGNQTIIFPSQSFGTINKLNEIYNYIEDAYVDTIDKEKLVESSIEELLQSLDPHSYYIPPSELKNVTAPLEGNFEGIGIEFRIIKDTVVVIKPMEGGPSEEAGILAGDRIVKVNDSIVYGAAVSNKKIMSLLKGEKGTTVNVTVIRKQEEKPLNFAITRRKIPIHSVDAAFMIDKETGYVKISRFARNTYNEFIEKTEFLKGQGLKKIIIDLRNNGGGYLNAATQITDEFLANKELIVYTEGKSRARRSIPATSKASLKNTQLYILINENSASASEILAGAIQDNDRGTIIGRRSFGKGLVQEQLELPDGSAVRLTVARYYTPTGRSIQKPYDKGIEEYRLEAYDRFNNGEMYYADSIKFPDSLKYFTPKGKVVYGGGGITPDIFIPIDTSNNNDFINQLTYEGIFSLFGFDYSDRNREKLGKLDSYEDYSREFSVSKKIFDQFVLFAKELGIESGSNEIRESREYIKNRIKASIAQNFWGNDGMLYVGLKSDRTVEQTLKLIGTKKGLK